MSDVKCFQLFNGQDIMGDVSSIEDGKITIRNPAAIHLVPSETQRGQFGVALMPFSPYAEFNKVELFYDKVVMQFDPSVDLLNNYSKLFGSGIQISNVMP
jgi:hypothetical protein